MPKHHHMRLKKGKVCQLLHIFSVCFLLLSSLRVCSRPSPSKSFYCMCRHVTLPRPVLNAGKLKHRGKRATPRARTKVKRSVHIVAFLEKKLNKKK